MNLPHLLAGGGEMGARIRAFDWSTTSVGPIENWPQSLLSTVSIIINSNFPMFLWWNDDLVQFYNDAYRKILGQDGRHPFALGETAENCWVEVWSSIGPLIRKVIENEESIYLEDQLYPIYRNGRLEQAHWTFEYSPVKDEKGKVAGVMVICNENIISTENYKKVMESEDLLSFAIESAELATWDLDPKTNRFTGNNRIKEWFGLPKEAEIDLFDAIQVIADEDRAKVSQAILEAIQYPGKKYEIEYTIINPITGKGRNVLAKGKAWFDENKIAYRFNGILQDITERVEIRKAEVEKENYFRKLTDAVPSIIWITKADGNCTFLNENWYSYTGQTADEALGFGWLDATHPDDKDAAGKAFLQANANQEYFSIAYRLKNRNGEYRWVMDRAMPKFGEDGIYEGFVGTVVDIQEQKQAEVQIKESEQRFRTLIASAPVAIGLFVGRDLVIENQNEIFNQIVGKGDVTGWKLSDAMPELLTEGQPFLQILDDVFTTGKMFQTFGTQVKIVQNGVLTHNYYDFTYTPIFNSEGEVYAILDIAIDVTENVLNQKRIEESEINLRNTISKAPVAMCIFKGKNHTVEIANEKMLAFWGKSAAQVLSKPIIEGLPEIKGEGFIELLDSVLETGEAVNAFEVPTKLPRKNGLELVYVDFVYEAFREPDGTISGIIAVAMEVTQQVLARKKIEEAEEKARLAIESADLGSYEVNLLTDEIKISERFIEIWGRDSHVSRKELTEDIHPDDRALRNEAHKKAMITGNLDYEARLLRADGSVSWVRIKGKVLFDKSGKPKTLLGVIQDITEQKQFAEQLTKLVKERTLELQRSNEDLLQFAHVASHDLKEPVRKIKIFSSMLQSDYGDLLPARGTTYLNKVHNATDRMFSMIEGVLAYSEFTSAEQKISEIDLSHVLDNIESDLEILIQQKQATIIRKNLPKIEGADVLIHQLFYNLINNALKFSKKDTPAIIEIDATSEFHEGIEMVKIKVKDNGIGIDPKLSKKIFDVFSRLNAKDDYEGTGLGLALCKKIVERHHGTISADGIRGEEAVFTILLPTRQLQNIM